MVALGGVEWFTNIVSGPYGGGQLKSITRG